MHSFIWNRKRARTFSKGCWCDARDHNCTLLIWIRVPKACPTENFATCSCALGDLFISAKCNPRRWHRPLQRNAICCAGAKL